MKRLLVGILILFATGFKAQTLGGTKWVLLSIDDLETGVSKDIGASVKATLQFNGDSTYSGKFCNPYNGRFRSNKDMGIKMGVPSATKQMCMGIDKYEKEMFMLFTLAHKFRLEDEKLFVFTTNKKRLSYKRD